ncbi:inosine triphosphate pyrophosphatase-like protein [Dioszegia hungarica]|uniref:Inosine triphosphate pyrophosphatase-like protein n=1 Tax=Dioszegia hungarica TaxID=4972 RepID=A0AA38LRA5_9TREE|nr:inosine triphosphate pyrophosphatase-like protein [Dioszegia hungarica]KAI9632308.1 inosine triphosphate pyrophosphatase-like protein [Dioszegia hungarica]
MSLTRPAFVTSKALKLPVLKELANRRIILASSSPRRKEIFETAGLRPEIIPSKFAEDLAKDLYDGNLADYPIATAGEKAIDVYESLVRDNDRDPPDLVISADTVVIFPPERITAEASANGSTVPGMQSQILEKPSSKEDQFRMLDLMAGKECEVITGVTIVYPTVDAPGYKLESMSCSTLCRFYDNSKEVIDAYIESNEGIDRAGGFAIQGLGGLLIEGVEGSYDNCVGFPSSAFWRWMTELSDEGTFSDAWN